MAGEAERHQAAVDKSDSEASDEYSDMSLDDLSSEAESRGLAKSGTKAELQARLRESDAA